MADDFDPRTWPSAIPWKPLWLDPDRNLFAIVDPEDYDWAIQWQWRPKPNSRGKKFYAVRSFRLDGGKGANISIFLHKEIAIRAYGPAPTRRRRLGDHWSGDSLDDRRSNLRWATMLENNRNVRQMELT